MQRGTGGALAQRERAGQREAQSLRADVDRSLREGGQKGFLGGINWFYLFPLPVKLIRRQIESSLRQSLDTPF